MLLSSGNIRYYLSRIKRDLLCLRFSANHLMNLVDAPWDIAYSTPFYYS